MFLENQPPACDGELLPLMELQVHVFASIAMRILAAVTRTWNNIMFHWLFYKCGGEIVGCGALMWVLPNMLCI